MATRAGVTLLALVPLAVAGKAAATAFNVWQSEPRAVESTSLSRDVGSAGAATDARPITAAATGLSRPIDPIVREGRTQLSDSLVVVRKGNLLTLHFDWPMLRTRRAEKFERLVRATLPSLYGPGMDSVLARLPQGVFARQGDLLTDLPAKGAYVLLSSGWKLALWPETRPGQDGPLVVAYRASVTQ
ncbi:MAG: hypothetical protein ACREON_10285 [Gemmatimonadaceae bacterium]